jgi:hypothetical protein
LVASLDRLGIEAIAIVLHDETTLPIHALDAHPRVLRPGVLKNVRQSFT